MTITRVSIDVDDQDKALRFSTDVLGFVKKDEFPVDADRWLTVVSPDEPDGAELALVPDGHPAVRPFKNTLAADSIPATSFAVDDLDVEVDRLHSRGLTFTQEPLAMGNGIAAVLDDTCGNLIQIAARVRQTPLTRY